MFLPWDFPFVIPQLIIYIKLYVKGVSTTNQLKRINDMKKSEKSRVTFQIVTILHIVLDMRMYKTHCILSQILYFIECEGKVPGAMDAVSQLASIFSHESGDTLLLRKMRDIIGETKDTTTIITRVIEEMYTLVKGICPDAPTNVDEFLSSVLNK